MVVPDPVMGSPEPGREGGTHRREDRQEFVGTLRLAGSRDRPRRLAGPGEASGAAPVVGDEQGAWRDDAVDEAAARGLASIWPDGTPDPAGDAPARPGVDGRAPCRARPPLDCGGPAHRVMHAAPRVRPPTRVSSPSTWAPGVPPMWACSGRTRAARRVGRIPTAVSYRERPRGRWHCTADRPTVCVEPSYAAPPHTVNGGCVRGRTVPAVRGVSRAPRRHRRTPGRVPKRNGFPAAWHCGQTPPLGQRARSRAAAHAA